MGANEGENALIGIKLEEVKKHFLDKFKPYIEKINDDDRGFANRVYAKHYAGVFLTHLKTRHFSMAIKVLRKNFFKSPKTFVRVIFDSFIAHI